MPDVPTIEEAGLKGVVLETWLAAFAPEKTPAAIIARLSGEMHKAMLDGSVAEKLAPTADELAVLVRDDSTKYERLAKELNIKLN